MIVVDDGHPMVQRLAALDAKFYLIGSRFMATATEYSDYDFYVEAESYPRKEELKRQLLALGFVEVEKGGRGYCKDKLLIDVLRWKSDDHSTPGVDMFMTTAQVIDERMAIFRRLKAQGFKELCAAFKDRGRAFYEFCEMVKTSAKS